MIVPDAMAEILPVMEGTTKIAVTWLSESILSF